MKIKKVLNDLSDYSDNPKEFSKMLELIVKYRELLMQGISYQDLLYAINYDYNVFKTRESVGHLIDDGFLEFSNSTRRLYSITNLQSVITSKKEYKSNIKALKLAYKLLNEETLQSEKSSLLTLQLENQDTILD